ncbi:tRNA (adenosine(37)-N6)-threonylcarbamoyltransferase complex ATPase subunit type 1 TsaE [Candidatus Gracilibacteria bacterium]|nr:tRNA (adenosine(37)-N6)-threonylcarbamoyltransferase complex ATPase subunit type 1 TsaE [Candidatus Gracilibacteria bacterium]
MKNTGSANISSSKTQKIFHNMGVEDYRNINIEIPAGSLIYLYGSVGMGKTTLSQILLGRFTGKQGVFTSPTYTYYNSYGDNIYHFDLYRLQNYEEFLMIGGEDILLNRSTGYILVEWPELIEKYISADISLYIEVGDSHDTRNLRVEFTPQYLS